MAVRSFHSAAASVTIDARPDACVEGEAQKEKLDREIIADKSQKTSGFFGKKKKTPIVLNAGGARAF